MADIHERSATADSSQRISKGKRHWVLVALCVIASVVGRSAGSLLGRYYFARGGQSYWLRTLLTSVGSPILLIPLLLNRPTQYSLLPTRSLKIKYLGACAGLGVLVAGNNFLYSLGFFYLPVSTFSLLCATQLTFTAVFAFFIAKQRISRYVVNSLVVIIIGTVVLALQAKGERPPGVNRTEYIGGFICTVLGSAVYGLIHPIIQVVCRDVVGKRSVAVAAETQAVICTCASVVSAAGLLLSHDFEHLGTEMRSFQGGKVPYALTLASSAVVWQMCVLGTYGLVCLVSSLFSIVVSTVTLPLIPILAVFMFEDRLNAFKVIGMVLAIWGFVSYAFGGYEEYSTKTAPPPPPPPV